MNLLPIYCDNKIEDGHYIHALPFCSKHCISKKCAAYYLIIENRGGYHCCPYGLTSYVDLKTKTIFTGFRAKHIYSKEKARNLLKDQNVYNPVLQQPQIGELISASLCVFEENLYLDEKRAEVESISHEAKK